MEAKMKIGYPTHPRRDPVEEIAWIGANGFDFVDLFLEPDLGAAERISCQAIKDALACYKLGSVGHLAWYLPIGSPIPRLREAAVEVAEAYLHKFKQIGVNRVTIHANWPPSLFTDKEGLEYQTESLEMLLPKAARLGISMLYEPVGHAHETEENLKSLFNRFPDLQFHLDIGHFNLNMRNPLRFVKAFKNRLTHIHLHDNDGTKDQHLPMGTGKIEWEPLIEELKTFYTGTITLEIFTPVREYVLLSRDLLLRLWGPKPNSCATSRHLVSKDEH